MELGGKAGTLNYELEGRALGAGAFESELGKFDDFLSVQTRLTLSGLPLPRTGSRGGLMENRARRLLLLVVITLLMWQTGFIEDPFSPVLGFTGVGMIALGLVWGALTIGFWANNDSPGLPRVSRIWLYLGYILFSIAVLNWSVASHDILQVDFFTGQAALCRFGIFGKPLIYAIFAVTLAASAMEGEGESRPDQ